MDPRQWAQVIAGLRGFLSYPRWMFLKDLESTYVFCTNAYARVLGLEQEGIFGKTDYDLFPEEIARSFREEDGEVLRLGIPQTMEAHPLHADGSLRWVRTTKSTYRDENNRPIGIMGDIEDITEEWHHRSEQTRLNAILRTTADLISTATMELQITYMNASGRRVLGWPNDEDPSDHRIPDVHPAWAAKIVIETAIPQALEEGSWSGESAILTKDGTEIPVSQVLMVHKNAKGIPEYFSTIMRDIREARSLRDALAQNEARLLEAQRLAHFGHWEINHSTELAVYSQEAARIFEFDPMKSPLAAGQLEKIIHDRLHPEDRKRAFNAFRDSVRGHTAYDMAYRLVFPDQRTKHIHAQGQSSYDEQGKAERSIGTVQDVTDQVNQKKRLEEYSSRLEQMVDQRTDELRAALFAAETANREKSSFYERMSHKLYTPLNSILGFTQLLEAETNPALPRDQRDSIMEIMSAGRHLQKLVDTLLDYSS